MKKWASVLLASSLVFSTIGATTVTNDVSAKESTKVETAATGKLAVSGFYFGESKSTVKKKAKAKGWKLIDENGGSLVYKRKVYGHQAHVYFTFELNRLKDVMIMFKDTNGINSWNQIQKYHNDIRRKLKKDLKQSGSVYESYNRLMTMWYLKSRQVTLFVQPKEAVILYQPN